MFLALLLVVDLWWSGGERFSDLSPHPFWIIVLLMASFYGPNEGLAAAVLSSLALLVFNVPEQGFDEDRSAWLLRLSVNPVLWVLVTIVLGEIRAGLQRRLEGLEDDLQYARKEVSAITLSHDRLSEIKSNLEVRVAAHVKTVDTLYRASRAIEQDTTTGVFAGIPDLLRSVLEPKRFSFFLLNGGLLEVGACEGWSKDDRFLTCFDEKSSLFQSVIGERQTLVVVDASHEVLLSGQGVLAGPLICPDSGRIIGLLKIEELGFSGLHAEAVQNFKVVCEWIGAAYAKARRAEILAEKTRFDPERQILPTNLFEPQQAILLQLARDIGFDACALFVGFEWEPQDTKVRRAAGRNVREYSRAGCSNL